MKKLMMLYALLALGLVSCGGGGGAGGTPQPVSVFISPTTASVDIGNTVQFTATVRNTTNTAVNWLVNDVAGGNATVGTITTGGLYTAPATVPSPATVTVKAMSVADPSKSASATVTITAPPIVVTISPTTATVTIGQTQQFTAVVTRSANTNVSWSVSSGTQGDPGSVSDAGLYQAPLWVSSQTTVSVKATSVADPTKSDTATITIPAITEPVLLWSRADFQRLFYGVTADADGNLIAGGLYYPRGTADFRAVAASYDATGALRWSFDMGDEYSSFQRGLSLEDGSSLWTGYTGSLFNENSLLLGLTADGQESTRHTCPDIYGFSQIVKSADRIYVAGGIPPKMFISDTNGNIDCENAITLKDDASARVSGIWTDGTYLLAAGDFRSISPGGTSDIAGFAARIDIRNGQILWEKHFQDMYGLQIFGTKENGESFAYVAGTSLASGPLLFFTTKLDEDGNQLPQWPQTWDGDNPDDSLPSYEADSVPDPAGGAIVVGRITLNVGGLQLDDCGAISYRPDGSVRWKLRRDFSENDDVCEGADVFNGKFIHNGVLSDGLFLFVAGSTQGFGANQKTLAASFALPPE